MKRILVISILLHYILSIVVLASCTEGISSDVETAISRHYTTIYQNNVGLNKAFDQISEGLAKGDINEITHLLPSQCFLSLSNGISGYYSYNQTYYILQDFFKVKRPISFKYTSIVSNNNPYATGIFTYEIRNRRETAQVFISVESKGTGWQISQITIK